MMLCWERNPRLRPNFVQVIEMLLNDVSSHFREVSFYHTSYLKGQERSGAPGDRPSAPSGAAGGAPSAGDAEDEEEDSTAETPLRQAPSAGFNPDSSSLNDMDDDRLQRCFSDCIDDDEDDDNDDVCVGDVCCDAVAAGGGVGAPGGRRGCSPPGTRDEKLPSDGSKGSKVSNLSNGSIINGRMCFSQQGSRTTAC